MSLCTPFICALNADTVINCGLDLCTSSVGRSWCCVGQDHLGSPGHRCLWIWAHRSTCWEAYHCYHPFPRQYPGKWLHQCLEPRQCHQSWRSRKQGTKTLNLLFLLGDGTFGRGKKKKIFFFFQEIICLLAWMYRRLPPPPQILFLAFILLWGRENLVQVYL